MIFAGQIRASKGRTVEMREPDRKFFVRPKGRQHNLYPFKDKRIKTSLLDERFSLDKDTMFEERSNRD